jgi:ABC-type taurine transport system substrate-binding protein
MVRVAEISRFLGQDAGEVRDMLELDGLPHAKVPGKTKPGVRVALRDLHGFMLKRWQGETVLRDYAVFCDAFWNSQRGKEAA